ncbi:hypothetical protein Gotri_001319 [Gossypium trilobum]|uniref:Uncharacterized protein n=1 Tax=Gossypium trilobum TaxID=34281 RepID=A0A7J9FEB1_9ROSI|nr:hypothetical protein [Gossypium trilobum]MBA0783632.1 hypothetical protein [Gossypium trilobum]
MDKILFTSRRSPNNSCGARILSNIKTKVAKPFYEMQSFVKVRGVNVLVTEISICQIYDAPYYYRNYLYKIDLKEFRNIDIEEILRLLTRRKEI